MISCLKLYSPAIVLLILAGVTGFTDDNIVSVVVRLVLLAGALALSIHEQRRLAARRENGKRKREHRD